MSRSLTPEAAARVSLVVEQARASVFNPLPIGDAVELDPEDGWMQWDLAVRLNDAQEQQA